MKHSFVFSPTPLPPRTEITLAEHISFDFLHSLSSEIVVLADRNIAKFCDVAKEILELPPGEAAKTREVKQQIEDRLLEKGIGRDCLLIGIGGGAASDLVGYLASTYLRGVAYVLIPTTLLAMVDASVGGKTGVNTPHGKNLIGTIYPPKAIYMSLAWLHTLPAGEWLNGLAEVIKYGLIYDASLFELIEQEGFDVKDPKTLFHLVRRSVEIKIAIAEQDVEERSVRRILNFGHTVAHAIEQISNYKIPHGEAVATGCLAASILSHQLGYLGKEDLARIERLLKKLGYSLTLPAGPYLEIMRRDKKAKEGKIRFVLIDGIGHALPFEGGFVTEVEESAINRLLESL